MKHKLLPKLKAGIAALATAVVMPLAVVGQAYALPCNFGVAGSFFPSFASDSSAVSVGTKFTVNGAPTLTGAQVYGGDGDVFDVHLGTVGGSEIASGTFTAPANDPPQWYTVDFSSPVDAQEGTNYVVWYHSSGGGSGGYNFANDAPYDFASRAYGTNETATHIAQGSSGLYKYTSNASTVPDTAVTTNYWIFPYAEDSTGPDNVSSFAASDNAAGPAISWSDPAYDSNGTYADGGTAAWTDIYRIEGETSTHIMTVPGSTSSYAVNDATALPGTTYTYMAASRDACGNNSSGTSSSGFTTSSATLESMFDGTWPASQDTSTEKQMLGMHWESDTAGYVWGARVFRFSGSWPTGSPIKVLLWDNDGTLLASRSLDTYVEHAGWTDIRFNSPVAVSANHDYVIGYYSDNGKNAYTNGAFSSAVDNGSHLTGRADTTGTPNGVYAQGSGVTNTTFPTNRAPNSTWYGVDVNFKP